MKDDLPAVAVYGNGTHDDTEAIQAIVDGRARRMVPMHPRDLGLDGPYSTNLFYGCRVVTNPFIAGWRMISPR